jgi:hypothetical protein
LPRQNQPGSLGIADREAKSSKLAPVASAADHLGDELSRLEQQRNRYAMAAETATDPKVSLAHLRNVERLDEEIEAIQKALEAMPSRVEPSSVEQLSAEQAVPLGFDYGDDDDEQTRVFDLATMPSDASADPSPAPAKALAKPVIRQAPIDRPPAPPQAPARSESMPAADPHAWLETSSPFGRRLQQPSSSFDGSGGSGEFALPPSGLRRASTLVLVAIVLSALAGGVWYALEPPAPPVKRETKSEPTVIEAVPVPSDAQHR